MMRLDQAVFGRGLVASRSQAESYIKLGKIKLNGQVVTKPGQRVEPNDKIKIEAGEIYVSRAGLKLASVAGKLGLNFKDKVVLDVGSSTGGFSDYALKHGAAKVIAVDVGTDQMHPSLRDDSRLELHEQTDIRSFKPAATPDIVVIDVSFISLREILPAVAVMSGAGTQIVAMVKPQFESSAPNLHKGVVKNDRLRRMILKDFEDWAKSMFVITDKADSDISGAKGNLERFYNLRPIAVKK